ncbi:MAG: hypothetical protein R3351_07265, partial [Nitrospirales bacterium]|nr:hypothetical protein [Nitrospirales bacterium]
MKIVETSQSSKPISSSLLKVNVSKDELDPMKQVSESEAPTNPHSDRPKIEIRQMNFFYGSN